MKRSFLVTILSAILLLNGCSKDAYTSSMQASLTVSDSVSQAIPIIQQLQSANLLTASEARQAYTYLQTVTVGNTVFRHTAQTLHASGQTSPSSYIAAADVFVKGVDSQQALAAIRIVNPQAQAKVMLYLQAVDTVLLSIQTMISTGKVKPTPAPAVASILRLQAEGELS